MHGENERRQDVHETVKMNKQNKRSSIVVTRGELLFVSGSDLAMKMDLLNLDYVLQVSSLTNSSHFQVLIS